MEAVAPSDCLKAVEVRHADSLIVDPQAFGPQGVSGVLSLLEAKPKVPVVAYVELNAPNMLAVAKLSNHGLADAFLHPLVGVDAVRFSNFIACLDGQEFGMRFLGAIERSVGRLPTSMFRATVDLFGRPQRYMQAGDLAIQSGTVSRQLYRRFEVAQLASPRKLLVVARMSHALPYLQDPNLTVEEISRKIGYQGVRSFVHDCREIFGCCPSALRAGPKPEDLLRSLLEWYCKPPKCAMNPRMTGPKTGRQIRRFHAYH